MPATPFIILFGRKNSKFPPESILTIRPKRLCSSVCCSMARFSKNGQGFPALRDTGQRSLRNTHALLQQLAGEHSNVMVRCQRDVRKAGGQSAKQSPIPKKHQIQQFMCLQQGETQRVYFCSCLLSSQITLQAFSACWKLFVCSSDGRAPKGGDTNSRTSPMPRLHDNALDFLVRS